MAIQLDGTTGISTTGNIIADGTLSVGTFNPSSINATGNVAGANLNTAGALSVGGNAVVTGDLTVTGNASLSGNIVGDKITNGTTSVEIQTPNGNANITIGGTSNVAVFTTTGVNVTGAISANGNITGGNVNAGGLSLSSNVVSALNSTSNITTTANIAGGYFLGNGSLLTGIDATSIQNGTSNVRVVSSGGNVAISVGGTSNVAVYDTTGEYVTGLISATGNITAGNLSGTNIIGTLTTASQTNITAVGTLGSLSVTGNATSGNVLTGGLISSTGNITGNYILGNGSQLTGIDATSIQNGTSNVRVVSSGGNVAIGVGGTSNVAVYATTGEFVTGLISATGNITGDNLNAAGLSLSSNVVSALNSTANITTTANIAGSYILGNGSLLTGIDATSIQNGTSNVRVVSSGGNVAIGVGGTSNVAVYDTTGEYVTGLISATGNITGGNLSGTSIVGTLTTASQTNITAVGTLSGLSVTGNTTSGNVLTGGLISATGNITGGNLSGTSIVGTLTTATQTNITSVGTLGSLSVTGNTTSGNVLTGGLISSTGTVTGSSLLGAVVSVTANVTGGNVLTGGLISATGNVTGGNVISNTVVGTGLTLISTGDLTLSTTGNINANNEYINNIPQPQQNADAANKQYVDNLVSTAISYHSPVIAATISNLDTATGGTITYAQPNGVANGVGATLTTTGSFNLIDTANIQTIGTRVLVKDEGNAVFNGVYTWANATVIVRATDADTYGAGNPTQLGINDYFFVQSGNVNAGAAYIVNAPSGTITFGTSNITFAEFSKSQIYTANTSAGISLAGTVINALVDNVTTAFSTGNIVVKASAQLTTPNIGAATGTSVSVTGTVSAGNIGTPGFVSAVGNVVAGNVVTGGLISSTGTITSSANITGGNLLTGGLISATGNISGGNLSGTNIVGTLTTASQTNITSVGTLGSLAVTGNTTSGNFVGTLNGSGANVTSISATNISSGTLDQTRLANASLTVNGTSIALGGSGTVTATATGTLTIGTGLGGTSYNGSTGVTITNTGVTSIVAGTNISVSGGTGAVTVNVSGTVASATTAATVTTAAQPNITSVGTLSGLTINNATTAITNGATAGTGNIGASGAGFNTIFAKATSAQYADLAESYAADAKYVAGTVLTFGGSYEVTLANESNDVRVAGIVSTNPAHVMNASLDAEHVAVVALTGRVPTSVVGTVRKGDMMVSAGNGAAQACATPAMGTVIGKALENFNGESGTIEIVVGRL